MAAIPVPPHHGHDNGHHAAVVDVDPVDDLLRDLSLDGGSKKKDKKKPAKIHLPIEPEYEGYTLTRLSAPSGQRPTWARVGKRALPFSNAKLHKMAMDHRKASGHGPATDYNELLTNQQGIIDRLIAEKVRDERDHHAIWVLFDVQKNQKDIPQNFFRVIRETISIQVILRRQDRGLTSAADQTTSNTAAAHNFGEIIDLTMPFEERRKKDKKDKKSKGDGDDIGDALADILDQLPSGGDNHHGHEQHHNHHQQEDPYARAQRERAQWEQDQAWREYWAEQQYRQQQQQQHQQQQPPPGAIPVHGHQQNVLPQAPMPPQSHANPFQPEVGHPAQYELPPTLPAHTDNQPQHDYSARHYARSPSRHRSSSRRRNGYRQNYTPSISSSQQSPRDDGFWSPAPDSDFTPPSTPDREDAIPYSGMQRRHSVANHRYYQDRRTRYPDERGIIQPAITYRSGRDFPQRYDRPARRRPSIHHAATYDDYPGARRPRAITNYAEGWEDADYRPRRGSNGVDFLRDLQHQRRRPRRHEDAGILAYGVADPFLQ